MGYKSKRNVALGVSMIIYKATNLITNMVYIGKTQRVIYGNTFKKC